MKGGHYFLKESIQMTITFNSFIIQAHGTRTGLNTNNVSAFLFSLIHLDIFYTLYE
jgi:hypothetical protein